jgi:predicted nucleic-acid-binding Zn-ribbon protein
MMTEYGTIPCKKCGYILDLSNVMHVRCPKCNNMEPEFLALRIKSKMSGSSKIMDIYERIKDEDRIEAVIVDSYSTAETMIITLRGAARQDPKISNSIFNVGAFEGKGKIEITGRNVDGNMKPLPNKTGPMILIIPKDVLPLVQKHYPLWSKVDNVHNL